MTDGDKIAAAILAAEASRQRVDLDTAGKPAQIGAVFRGGRDISGEIWAYYQEFIRRMTPPA